MNLSKRTELRRIPDRGSHDRKTIDSILDAGFLAHVGFSLDGQPFVIPTLYSRVGERLYLHGSAASRMLRELETGVAACVTVTRGWIGLIAVRLRSFHEAPLRRCIWNVAEDRGSRAESQVFARYLCALSPNISSPADGRMSADPARRSCKRQRCLNSRSRRLDSKVRSGPPLDDESDYGLPVWAGVLPLEIKSRPLDQTTNWSKVSLFPTMSAVMMLGSLAIQR